MAIGGTLFDQITAVDDPWSDDKTRFYASEILDALQFMHSKNIIYRYGVAFVAFIRVRYTW